MFQRVISSEDDLWTLLTNGLDFTEGTHLSARKFSLENKCKLHSAIIPLRTRKAIKTHMTCPFRYQSPLKTQPSPLLGRHRSFTISQKKWNNTNKLHVVTCLEKNFTVFIFVMHLKKMEHKKIKEDKIFLFYLVTRWLVRSLKCSVMRLVCPPKTTMKWIKTEVYRR